MAAVVTNRTTTNPRVPIESNDGECDQASSPQQQLSRQLFPNEVPTEYKNSFIFPESIPSPSVQTLRNAHDEAVFYGEPSHQFQLTRAGTNLLSLQEVILPSIRHQTNSALKGIQAVAQRHVKDGLPNYLGKNVIEATETCRKCVNRCIGEAMKVAGDSWRQREQKRAQSRMERHAAQMEQRKADKKQAKQRRKEERALARRRKIALLELETLEKALGLLKIVENKYNELDTTAQVPLLASEPMELDSPDVPSEDTADDDALASERINSSLSNVSSAMEESETLHNDVCAKRDCLFGENDMMVDSLVDGSAQCDDNGNDMMVEKEEEESDTTAVCHTESALNGCFPSAPTERGSASSTPVHRRTRRSRSRGRTENEGGSASSSTPVYRNTRSRSRGRTENDEGGSSASSYTPKTPTARRTRSSSRSRRQITSPLLSPIEKDPKMDQDEFDTTVDTADLTGMSDDTVQHEDDEVSLPFSGAMVHNPSQKYHRACPHFLSDIYKSHGLTEVDLLDQCPSLHGVLTTFEREESIPAIYETSVQTQARRAQGLLDAAVDEDVHSVDGENVYTVGSIIDFNNMDNLPPDCAILGLHGQHSMKMTTTPPTEGHEVLVSLIEEYLPQFATTGTDMERTRVVQVTGLGKYIVKPSRFSINNSCTIALDSGSIRSMLHNKLNNARTPGNYLANLQQSKIDYFRNQLPSCPRTLGFDSAKDFLPHSDLPKEDRKDPNAGIDEYEPTLNMLKEKYPRPPPTVPSEELNSHLMTIEVAIKHRHLMELILSLHGDYDNSDTWEKITQLVAAEEAIPSQLEALFEEPDWENVDRRDRHVAWYLIDLIKVLSRQCWISGFKTSECGSKEELASLELDHILEYFFKSHDTSSCHCGDTTTHPNPYGTDDLLKRALYESFKCRLVHFMWHHRGKHEVVESQFEEGMCRDLVLKYDSHVEEVLGLFEGNRQPTVCYLQ